MKVLQCESKQKLILGVEVLHTVIPYCQPFTNSRTQKLCVEFVALAPDNTNLRGTSYVSGMSRVNVVAKNLTPAF
jgi:hypothetical protein